ncbi:MAG: endo-1,4-beta-xylanase [Cyanobacteria bacterium P01_E01_bin.35]
MDKKLFNYGRRSFLLGLGGFGLANLLHQSQLSIAQAEDLTEYLTKRNKSNRGGSLRQIAATKGIVYGSFHERSNQDFAQDRKFQRFFLEDYGLIVGGFYGVTVGPFSENNYNFEQIDTFINFAEQNNLNFRAHPMIWSEFNSPWVVEKFKSSSTTSAEIEQIFTNHITTLGKKYAGRVDSWDVVNEGIRVEDGRADNLKDTALSGVRGEKYPTWLNFLGANYIEQAFRIAAAADPQATLLYNENNLTYSSPSGNSYWEQRRTAVLKLLERLKSKGTPIHALGVQSHLLAHHNKDFDGKKFRKFLSDVASMGLKIIISELDVNDRELPKNIKLRDRIVAESYYQYLSVVLDEPAVTTIVNWGITDRHTWLSSFTPRKDGAAVRPLLRDRRYGRKLAWNAVARALKEAPSR